MGPLLSSPDDTLDEVPDSTADSPAGGPVLFVVLEADCPSPGERDICSSESLRDELGFVRAAEGGTLFLDEIGDLPMSSQPVLLRVLQEQEVLPLGATRPTKVDIRVVAATHQALDAHCQTGRFRSDLLARLRGYTHRVLPLRDRREVGVVLADILERVAGDRAGTLTLSRDAARALLAYDWPLNIRELEQGMASAAALADSVIEPRHLPAEVLAPKGRAPAPDTNDALRDCLVSLLYGHRGNVTAVSRALGKAPEQIHRWMRRYALDADTYRELASPRRSGQRHRSERAGRALKP